MVGVARQIVVHLQRNNVLDILTIAGTWLLVVIPLFAIRGATSNTKKEIEAQAKNTRLAIEAQADTTSRTLSADVFVRLNDRWDSGPMRSRRKSLAKAIPLRKGGPLPSEYVVDDVINFFEDLGLLVRKQQLDVEAAWHSFSFSARLYWEAVARDYVDDLRQEWEDETLYSEFEYLVSQMEKLELEKRGLSSATDIAIESETRRAFVLHERKLDTRS